MKLYELKRLVKAGEGEKLEFKRKAAHPDKIAKEIVAFANTQGGIVLIGVDDDATIYGSKTPEEDEFAIRSFLEKYCTPEIKLQTEKIRVNSRREVLALHIQESSRKPHYILPAHEKTRKLAYVRVRDMSVKASREMIFLLRQSRKNKGVAIHYGDMERKLMQELDHFPRITLEETRQLLRTSKRKASYTLVQLVRAGILNIHPTEKGDYFSLSEEAFQ